MEQKSSAYIFDKINQLRIIRFLFPNDSFKQFLKYLIVGASSFAIEYLFFYVLLEIFDVWYVLANAVVYAIIFWFNFIFNRIWSFKSKVDFKKQLFKYALLFAFNLLAITGIILFLSDIINLDPLISKIIVMLLIIPWNFTMYKKVIYK